LLVDPNTAPPAVLGALPHLGPATIKRIVAAREQAPLESLHDLDARVRGIGPATVVLLSPFLRFERPATGAIATLAGPERSPAAPDVDPPVHLARTP
jgi:hypothetical protein